MINKYPVSTFGHIYEKALHSHLRKIGHMLSVVRKARHEDIESVAAAVNLRPEVLQQIEEGQHNARVATLYSLCDYYEIEIELIVSQSELLRFEIA